MNNPNPFVPKGSLTEQQDKRRTRMKLGVYCVLGVSVVSLMGMLIQGCKKEEPPTPAPDATATPVPDTNTPPMDVSNQPPVSPGSNTVSVPSPITPAPVTPAPVVTAPVTPVTPEAPGAEYTIVKGDTLGKIAKKNGVTLKALEAANPTVKPTKMKPGQKLVIPPGGKTSADATAAGGATAVADNGGESYTVKSGDTLSKIAKAHGVKVKALQAANNLATSKIKVGQKLTIPSKAEAPAVPVAAPAAVPAPDTSMPAPPVPSVPAPSVPAPGHN
jgi:LysM repeat protein